MSQQHSTKITKARHIKFLRSVFWLGLTAFGGPQMHIPQFKRRLVDKHKFFDQDTLKDVNAFCSLLPGPSTTQTITVLGLKMGGPMLALMSLGCLGITRCHFDEHHRTIAQILGGYTPSIHATHGRRIFGIFGHFDGSMDPKIHPQLQHFYRIRHLGLPHQYALAFPTRNGLGRNYQRAIQQL